MAFQAGAPELLRHDISFDKRGGKIVGTLLNAPQLSLSLVKALMNSGMELKVLR